MKQHFTDTPEPTRDEIDPAVLENILERAREFVVCEPEAPDLLADIDSVLAIFARPKPRSEARDDD